MSCIGSHFAGKWSGHQETWAIVMSNIWQKPILQFSVEVFYEAGMSRVYMQASSLKSFQPTALLLRFQFAVLLPIAFDQLYKCQVA